MLQAFGEIFLGVLMKKQAVVFIHGVGPAKDGEVLGHFLANQKPKDEKRATTKQKEVSGEMGVFAVSGDTYPSVRLSDGLLLVESGWSEFRPVRRGTFASFFEALALLWGMLKLATYDVFAVGSGQRTINQLGSLYVGSFLVLLFWCIHPAILSLFFVTNDYLAFLLWIGALSFVVWLLSRYDQIFRWGALWIVGSLLAAAAAGFGWLSPQSYVSLSAWTYVGAQIGTITVGWFFMLGQLRKYRSKPIETKAARLAIAFLPFFAAGGVGALVWTLALARAASFNAETASLLSFDDWAKEYSGAIIYPVFNAEMYNGLSMLIVGCMLIIPALSVFIRGAAQGHETTAAETRRVFARWLFASSIFVLVLIPLFMPVMLILPDMLPRAFTAQGEGVAVFAAYATWSTRILPFLPLFFGGLAVVLKITGDIVFYLLPPSDQIGARTKAILKLKKIVRQLLADDRTVLVVSHSQGTMIALDSMNELANEGTALDTVGLWLSGSPSVALYHDFLLLNRVEGSLPRHLKNFFRRDDVIAGSISDELAERSDFNRLNFEEITWENGGHINYWKDFKLKEIRAALKEIEAV